MKKSFIVVFIVLVAVIAAGVLLYPRLSEMYAQRNMPGYEDELVDNAGSEELAEAADFTVSDMNGNEVALSDFFGKPIVINFWATWCSPCRSELPAFDTAYQKYKGDIEFLMVSVDDFRSTKKSIVEDFIKDSGYSFPVYKDLTGEAAKAYGIHSIPVTLFIDKDGMIIDSRIGAMSEEQLNKSIERMGVDL